MPKQKYKEFWKDPNPKNLESTLNIVYFCMMFVRIHFLTVIGHMQVSYCAFG